MATLLRWYERLALDRRVIALGEADRDDGAWWVYVECHGERSYDSLFDELWQQGYRTLARRDHASLWLEPSMMVPLPAG
jgi:hypothetical protein